MAGMKWKESLQSGTLILALAGIVMAVSTFLPYIYSDKKSWTLMEGTDGIFFLGFAALILIFLSFQKETVAGVLSMIVVYLGAYELLHTYSVMAVEKAVELRPGYFVLLTGTLIMLAGTGYFVYQKWLKNRLDQWFDKRMAAQADKK